jgi:glycosyltransferase involved in cell wall biosynthesis
MSNNPLPLVSVIIPTYNRALMLGAAIESALKQTYTNLQLIVVDDGSTDNTEEMVKSKYPEVKYVLQEHGGQAKARNTGLRNADGVYIASLDSDDVWTPVFLEKIVAKLEEGQMDFVFANWYQGTTTGEWKDSFSSFKFLKSYILTAKDSWVDFGYSDLRKIYIRDCPSPSSSLVLRRSSIVSGWNEVLNIGDDWCLLLDIIMSKECKVSFTTEKLWYKQMDKKNIFDGRNRFEVIRLLHIDDTEVLMNRYASFLTKNEQKIIQENYITNMVALARHMIVRKFNIVGGFKFLRRAMVKNPSFIPIVMYRMFIQGSKRHLKKNSNVPVL